MQRLDRIGKYEVSVLFNQACLNIYIYIYICMCVHVCVCVFAQPLSTSKMWHKVCFQRSPMGLNSNFKILLFLLRFLMLTICLFKIVEWQWMDMSVGGFVGCHITVSETHSRSLLCLFCSTGEKLSWNVTISLSLLK